MGTRRSSGPTTGIGRKSSPRARAAQRLAGWLASAVWAAGNTQDDSGYRTGVDGVVALTIGMATYNDFNGVYFTLQALRWYQDLRDTELLVIDNYGCPDTKALVEGW